MNHEHRLKFCYRAASNGERAGDLSGVFDFANIDDCACEPLPSASTRVRFGVACVSSKLHKRFGASPLARGVETARGRVEPQALEVVPARARVFHLSEQRRRFDGDLEVPQGLELPRVAGVRAVLIALAARKGGLVEVVRDLGGILG